MLTNIEADERMVPTFSIYEGTNQKVSTLIHCFLSEFFIDPINPPSEVIAKDGRMYKVIYNEFFIPRAEYSKKLLKVIGSFQKHSYGSFVVVRISQD